MRLHAVWGVLAAALAGGSGMAADPLPGIAAAPVGGCHGWTCGIFGEVSGGYLFAPAVDDWQLFGPAVVPGGSSKETTGPGFVTEARLGYRFFRNWDVAVGVRYGRLSEGDDSVGAPVTGAIEARQRGGDLELGRTMTFGQTDVRLAASFRYMEWDTTVNVSTGAEILHQAHYLGPRAVLQVAHPLRGNWDLLGDLSVAYLWEDDLETEVSQGPWNCADCSNPNSSTWNVEGKLALGWSFRPGATLALGYQAQWWENVNVAITDNSGAGLNEGESGYLIHGPFAALKFNFGGP